VERVFTTAVFEEGLSEVISMEPLLTGEDVMETLGLTPNRLIGELLERMVVWQTHHSNATRSEALDMLRFIYKSLPVQISASQANLKKQNVKALK
jgi:hypothetical protein